MQRNCRKRPGAPARSPAPSVHRCSRPSPSVVQPWRSGRASGDAKRIKELERELVRKDKALAETAALLVLKKKMALLWGDGDDDTPPKSDK